MKKYFSQNLKKNYVIPQKGEAYITAKLYKFIPLSKNYEMNHIRKPYITSKFIRASL